MPPMICFRRSSTSWRVQLYRRLFWTISRAETTTPPEPEALEPAVRILGLRPQELQGLGGGGHVGRLHVVADVVGHDHHRVLHVQLVLGGAGDHDVHRHLPGPFAGEELHAEAVGIGLHLSCPPARMDSMKSNFSWVQTPSGS